LAEGRIQPRPWQKTGADPHAYDAMRRVTSRTEPGGAQTQWQYDTLGRTTKRIDPDPDGAGSQAASETVYTYNAQGLLASVTDPLGHATSFEYASSSLVSKIIDAQQHETVYSYDDMGQVTSITAPDPDGMGSKTAPVTTYTYDLMR